MPPPWLPSQAFPTYTSLAQHLSSKHDGINSEDIKYQQLRGLQRAEVSSSSSSAQQGAESQLADLFAGPSLQEASTTAPKASSRGPVKAASAVPPSKRAGQGTAWGASHSLATRLKHQGGSGKAGAKAAATTISLGSMLRAASTEPARSSAALARGKAKGVGGVALKGPLLQQHQGQLVPRHGKLRRENAQRKQRLSHLKRLVLVVSGRGRRENLRAT